MVQQYASHNDDNGRNVYRLGSFGTVLPADPGMAKSADFRRNVQPFGKQLAHCGKLLAIFRHCHRLSLGQKQPVKLAGGGKLTKTSGKGLHTSSKLLFAKVFFKTQLRFAVATATKTLSTKNAPQKTGAFLCFRNLLQICLHCFLRRLRNRTTTFASLKGHTRSNVFLASKAKLPS